MATAVLSPAVSANAKPNVGDAVYRNGTIIQADQNSHAFGRDSAKTPVNRGSVSQYNTSGIPFGATITKAKLEVKASATDSTAFTSDVDIDVLANLTTGGSAGAWDSRLNQTDYSVQDAQFIHDPRRAYPGATLWADTRSSGNDTVIPLSLNESYGAGSVAQAWTATGFTGTIALSYYWWYLRSSGGFTSQTVTTKLYEAVGSAGSYTKGTLLDSGTPRAASLITTGGSLASFYIFTDATPTVTEDDVYISELSLSTGSGGAFVEVGILSTADGSTDNASVYADSGKYLQGFGGGVQWLTGTDVKVADGVFGGTTDSISSFPSFTSGTKYVLGSSEYSGESNFTELPNLKSNLQDALDARLTNRPWIGIRIQDFAGTTNGAERLFYSSKSGTDTITGYPGMVLTIEFTTPSSFVGGVDPQTRKGGRLRPLEVAAEEYDEVSEDLFRRTVESSIFELSSTTEKTISVHGREASSASKRERLLPRVGVKTFG